MDQDEVSLVPQWLGMGETGHYWGNMHMLAVQRAKMISRFNGLRAGAGATSEGLNP